MALNPMIAEEIPKTDAPPKFVLFGNAGTGKTTAACQLDDVLVAVTEPNAVPVIKSTNPKATVVVIGSTAELKELIALFQGGRPTADGLEVTWPAVHRSRGRGAPPELVAPQRKATYKALVLDSVGDWQRKLIREVVGRTAGKEIASRDDYAKVVNETESVCNDLRMLPVVVVMIFHAQEIVVEDARYVRLAVTGQKLPNTIAGFVNVVAYLFKKQGEPTADGRPARSRYMALTDGNERFITKAHSALPPVCRADLRSWVRAIADYRFRPEDLTDDAGEVPGADEKAPPSRQEDEPAGGGAGQPEPEDDATASEVADRATPAQRPKPVVLPVDDAPPSPPQKQQSAGGPAGRRVAPPRRTR